MGHQVNIFARRAEPIAIEEIHARMAERGLPLEWKPSPQTDALGTTNWISGRLIAQGNPRAQVVVGREALNPRSRKEQLEDAGNAIAAEHRDALLAAETWYALESDGRDQNTSERMLLRLADILADLGTGVIEDVDQNAFYDLATFRAQNGRALDGGA
jgi:hypothetical protein